MNKVVCPKEPFYKYLSYTYNYQHVLNQDKDERYTFDECKVEKQGIFTIVIDKQSTMVEKIT